jgi:hypothetical protein
MRWMLRISISSLWFSWIAPAGDASAGVILFGDGGSSMKAWALVLGFVLVTGTAHAQAGRSAKQAMVEVRPLPDEAMNLQAKFAPKLVPTARLKILGAAMKVRSQPAANSTEMLAHARTAAWEVFPTAKGADVDTLTFLVMMQASADTQDEMYATMQQMQAANNQRQAQRGTAAKMGEMSQELQMKLQMEQEQYSQCMEAVSNIMKKVSDTSSSIVQNMK